MNLGSVFYYILVVVYKKMMIYAKFNKLVIII